MPTISGQVVRLTDFVPVSAILDGFTFEGCTVVGPAVILPVDGTRFEGCTFEGDPVALFWEISPDRERVIGAIAVRGCIFKECRISGVGIAGPPNAAEAFREAVSTETLHAVG